MVSLCRVICLMYTCQVLLLIWPSNRHFKIIWTDCLRLIVVVYTVFLCVVNKVSHVFTSLLCH